jgi:SIR2-like domain
VSRDRSGWVPERLLRKLTVVLGAGASKGCGGTGIAATVKHEFCPPLVEELFDQRFDSILRRYGALAVHLDDVRTELKDPRVNFEKLLQEFYEAAERRDDRWSLDIPLYLRELLWTISDEYVEGSSKYDTLVQRVLSSPFDRVMFLNLNYDLFLEYALRDCNRHEFDSVDAYVRGNKKWMLIKPHGSVNWATVLENWPRYPSGDYKPFPSDLEEPPRFDSKIHVVLRAKYHPMGFYLAGVAERRLYPCMVVPVDNRKMKRFICPQEHEVRAKEFVQDCTTFLMIGFSGRDNDVLALLEGMPPESRVILVGLGDNEAVFERMCLESHGLSRQKAAIELLNDGFASFIESVAFKRLVAP